MKKKSLFFVLLTCVLCVYFAFTLMAQGNSEKNKENEGQRFGHLIKQIKTSQNVNEKQILIEKMIKFKPENTDEENVIINAIDNDDLDIQEATVQVIAKNKILRSESTLIKRFKLKNRYNDLQEREKFNKDIRIRSYTVIALSEMHSMDALGAFIDEIGDNPNLSNEVDIQTLGMCIAKYGKSALSKLIKKIKKIDGKNQNGKKILLNSIEIMTDVNAEDELKELFEDSNDVDIKSAVATALNNIGKPLEVKKLIKSLQEHEKKYIKGKSWLESKDKLIEEIGNTKNQNASLFLKKRIENELTKSFSYPNIYGELTSLAKIGGMENLQYLIDLFEKNYSKNLNRLVISAMGNGKMKEALQFLTNIIDEKKYDTAIKLRAATSLEKITSDRKKYMSIRKKIRGEK